MGHKQVSGQRTVQKLNNHVPNVFRLDGTAMENFAVIKYSIFCLDAEFR